MGNKLGRCAMSEYVTLGDLQLVTFKEGRMWRWRVFEWRENYETQIIGWNQHYEGLQAVDGRKFSEISAIKTGLRKLYLRRAVAAFEKAELEDRGNSRKVFI